MSSIRYEKETIRKLIGLYCRKKHGAPTGELCEACTAINRYAQKRLDQCPFGDEKKACSDCAIHCYKRDMRASMQQIMRYAGPRMLIYHPFDFLVHLVLDKTRRWFPKRTKKS